MTRLGTLLRRSLLRGAADRDLDEEIRFHLARETERHIAGGLSRPEAERAARMALGSPALVKERTREVWVWTALEQLLQDLRFGFRILTKSPALSLTAVALVALVIGGNATVFSMAHGILAKPSPGVHATGLMTVSWLAEDGFRETHNGYRVFTHFSEHASTFASITAYDFRRVTMMHENGSYALRAGIVSPNYFDTLGVRIVKGRGFGIDEATRGTSGLVAVVSHRLWQTTFQGADGILGQAITLNGQPATVVGVAEPGFHGAIMAELADLWLPLAGEIPAHLDQGRGTAVAMIGRLAAGRSGREAQAELSTLWSQMQADPTVSQTYRVLLVPYSATAGGNSLVSMFGYRILAIFSVVTLLTVLIVCANVVDRARRRPSARDRPAAVARRVTGARRPRPDRRGIGAFGSGVDRRLPLRVVGIAGRGPVSDPCGCARASGLPCADTRLDRDRLRPRARCRLYFGGHDRAGAADVEPAAAAFPESRGTGARRFAIQALGCAGGPAAGVFGVAADECGARLSFLHGGQRHRCRVRHAQPPDGDGEYVGQRQRRGRQSRAHRNASCPARPHAAG
jgi:hypothetical protein